MTTLPQPRFDHLWRMTDERGTFEHAHLTEPRVEHGYCTDDMARVVVVTARELQPSAEVSQLLDCGLRFLRDAEGADGSYRNRMDRRGRWTDQPGVDDCWGRSVWGLGTAAARAPAEDVRRSATAQFERAAAQRSPWPRAMAFAGLGAAELLVAVPDHRQARALLGDAADRIIAMLARSGWPWPEARLAYANAIIPETLIAAGDLLHRPIVSRRGLDLLAWLIERETFDGHLSVTPVGGRGLRDAGPAFDQQPIEVAALADACARAATIDTDERWPRTVAAAIAWFHGDNDGGHVMWDPGTGGGFDGLQASGPNLNEGAESTLALLSTLQHAGRLTTAP